MPKTHFCQLRVSSRQASCKQVSQKPSNRGYGFTFGPDNKLAPKLADTHAPNAIVESPRKPVVALKATSFSDISDALRPLLQGRMREIQTYSSGTGVQIMNMQIEAVCTTACKRLSVLVDCKA